MEKLSNVVLGLVAVTFLCLTTMCYAGPGVNYGFSNPGVYYSFVNGPGFTNYVVKSNSTISNQPATGFVSNSNFKGSYFTNSTAPIGGITYSRGATTLITDSNYSKIKTEVYGFSEYNNIVAKFSASGTGSNVKITGGASTTHNSAHSSVSVSASASAYATSK